MFAAILNLLAPTKDADEPLAFDKLVGGSIGHVDGKADHVQAVSVSSSVQQRLNMLYGEGENIPLYSLAVSHEVMQSGRHYVEFEVTRDGYFDCGILRPCKEWDAKDFTGKQDVLPIEDSIFASHSKFLDDQGQGYARGDNCYFGSQSNKLRRKGTVVELLLDLDKGTLSGYENGKPIFHERGFSGPYCWGLGIAKRGAVKIGRAPVPDDK